MKKLILHIDGERVEVWAQKHKGQLWYHLNGETRVYKPEENYGSSGSASANAEPGVIKAPMPGKIIKVACKNGDTVAAGDTLVIMEAMKMEYTLKADIAGVTEQLAVKADELVSAGQVLVVVKEPS